MNTFNKVFLCFFTLAFALSAFIAYRSVIMIKQEQMIVTKNTPPKVVTKNVPPVVNNEVPPALDEVPEVEENFNECNISVSLPKRSTDMSAQYWHFAGGSTPVLLFDFLNYKQSNVMYSSDLEAGDVIDKYIGVYCAPNSAAYTDDSLMSAIKANLSEKNNTNQGDMRPDSITITSSKRTTRWGRDVLDLTLNLDFDGYIGTQDVTILVTPKMIYEIMIDGSSQDTTLSNQAEKIFNSIKFN